MWVKYKKMKRDKEIFIISIGNEKLTIGININGTWRFESANPECGGIQISIFFSTLCKKLIEIFLN